jgi:hypothetical protein
MVRLPDRIILEPKPVAGWVLPLAIGLDRVHPGYLRYLTTASALKRQTNFVALSILDENAPDYLASHFRSAGLAENCSDLDPAAQVAGVLIMRRAADIIETGCILGGESSTALRVLHRIGDEPLSRSGYRALIDMMGHPQRERSRAFSGTFPVTECTLQAARRLPMPLLRPEVMTRLKSVDHIDELSAAFDLIFPLLPEAAQASAWQSLASLQPTASLKAWLRRLIEKVPRYPISGPLSDDEEAMLLSSPQMMSDTGRRLKNCLATLVVQPLLSRYVYYLWRDPLAVIELRCLSRGFFVLKSVHTSGNGTVDAETMVRVRTKFESTGRVLIGAEHTEARTANRAAKLFDVWTRGLPNFDDDDVIDLFNLEEAA